MTFTRTPGGLAEKWRFHQVPTIWLEGPTDLFFFQPISAGILCRFEPFHGFKNSRALIDSLKQNNYPYLVILDGDYSVLGKQRSPHRHVIVLPRYSYENLLWEPDAINFACRRHARCGDQKDLVASSMNSTVNQLVQHFLPALVLDIAARQMETSPKILPDRVDSLLKDQSGVSFDLSRLNALISSAEKEVDGQHVVDAERQVQAFLRDRCISHLINGHLLFGLLRRLFVHAANRERGANSVAAE